jgi:diguanylate cyclase (GGDEF)-like protein
MAINAASRLSSRPARVCAASSGLPFARRKRKKTTRLRMCRRDKMDQSRNNNGGLPRAVDCPQPRAVRSGRWLLGAVGLLCLWLAVAAPAATAAEDSAQLLKKADSIKLQDYPQFLTLLHTLQARASELPEADRDYVDYLDGWNSAYTGHYDTAVTALGKIADHSPEITLRFRATTTIVNVLSISRRYEEAFVRLNRLLDLLPQVADGDAREQALLVAAFTYVEVAQYDLTLRYARMVMDENWAGRGACKGGQLEIEALFRNGKLTASSRQLRAGIDACDKVGGTMYANDIRTYIAKMLIDERRYDEAIGLLRQHYDEVTASRYGRLISAYDALLAEAYRKKGVPGLAKQFGLDTIQNAVPHQYTEPLVNAYGTLYELAKDAGDFKAALAYHEQYALADKAYLDDASARHLAYQKVSHENLANRLQVDALNKQNHVLQLEQQLSAKAVETGRLYIALLALTTLFIALWAYRTKRSQLHFMTLSRLDGLTGICNRPHFIERAQRALEAGGKSRDPLCIVLCDLDHFKAINDLHGHATGDYVLKRVVAACQAHLGPNDLFGRFGGEEFGFLFPACGPKEARRRSELLRVAIVGITTKQDGADLTVSASFGVAATLTSGYELRQLLAHADSALYEAKRAGRNRVVLHDGPHAADLPTVERSAAAERLAENKRIAGA